MLRLRTTALEFFRLRLGDDHSTEPGARIGRAILSPSSKSCSSSDLRLSRSSSRGYRNVHTWATWRMAGRGTCRCVRRRRFRMRGGAGLPPGPLIGTRSCALCDISHGRLRRRLRARRGGHRGSWRAVRPRAPRRRPADLVDLDALLPYVVARAGETTVVLRRDDSVAVRRSRTPDPDPVVDRWTLACGSTASSSSRGQTAADVASPLTMIADATR